MRDDARRRWLVMAALVTLWMTAASPAAAHRFSIVVVTSDAAASAEAWRGFRMAVDESPDVTHAAGEQAGDHLGGIDVDIVTLDAAEPEATVAQVEQRADAGAAAVVTLAPGAVARDVSDAAASRGVLSVAVDAPPGDTGVVGDVVLRPRPIGQRDTGQTEQFASAFADEHGVPPTEAAQLGYDAGRLLDGLVSELGDTLEPNDELAAAARGAQDGLVAAGVQVAAGGAANADPATPDPTPASDVLAGRGTSTLRMVAGAIALLLVGGVVVAATRRVRAG